MALTLIRRADRINIGDKHLPHPNRYKNIYLVESDEWDENDNFTYKIEILGEAGEVIATKFQPPILPYGYCIIDVTVILKGIPNMTPIFDNILCEELNAGELIEYNIKVTEIYNEEEHGTLEIDKSVIGDIRFRLKENEKFVKYNIFDYILNNDTKKLLTIYEGERKVDLSDIGGLHTPLINNQTEESEIGGIEIVTKNNNGSSSKYCIFYNENLMTETLGNLDVTEIGNTGTPNANKNGLIYIPMFPENIQNGTLKFTTHIYKYHDVLGWESSSNPNMSEVKSYQARIFKDPVKTELGESRYNITYTYSSIIYNFKIECSIFPSIQLFWRSELGFESFSFRYNLKKELKTKKKTFTKDKFKFLTDTIYSTDLLERERDEYNLTMDEVFEVRTGFVSLDEIEYLESLIYSNEIYIRIGGKIEPVLSVDKKYKSPKTKRAKLIDMTLKVLLSNKKQL